MHRVSVTGAPRIGVPAVFVAFRAWARPSSSDLRCRRDKSVAKQSAMPQSARKPRLQPREPRELPPLSPT